MTSPNEQPEVDTAASSNNDATREYLEKQLPKRPDAQDLKDRHILLDTTAAPALQARQAELERQRITENLKKGLAKRPEKEELVESELTEQGNILSASTVAPGLQAQQRDLQKHMRKDSLEKQLQNRPDPEQLIREGILNADENPLKDV